MASSPVPGEHDMDLLFAGLAAQLPPGVVIDDPDILESYRRDRADDPKAGTPRAVARPTSAEEVSRILRWASANAVAVVPRGAGSSLSGGSTAVDGCLVLSTERMRAVAVDPVTRVAVVGPGLLNAELKAAAAEHGLWYPPDPSSYEFCSIGGNIATNAGGLCCVKYGVTTDYVLGLEVVLADGEVLRLGGPRIKDTAGLSLLKLFVGSEGTLGVFTEATLRLLPAQPKPSTLIATFGEVRKASEAVLAICGKLRPAMLEFMDRATINAVEDMLRMGLDRQAEAMLVIQSDAPGEAAGSEVELIAEIVGAVGAAEVFVTTDPHEGEAFVVARRAAIPAVERLGHLLLEDVGVPIPKLPDLIDGVRAIGAANEVTIAVIAHAGDGNTHPLIVHDPEDEDETRRAERAFGEIMDLAIRLDGTITGEHGVGRLKKGWLPDQIGPAAMALSRRIKTALDPEGVLNPGAIF
ncbi:FAD-binding oxidoreductase [Segniliparus rugosus]|uniref:Glycolate oxidase, subunit GlcD n=1 Tax=Segniliparus rugosus (strain ATCC BAA-974 / DSM 45345 / CCUG 50838 / CIP 108380 / JCM 13579 / CDC 945) TaxID=679197 RepID=E5XLL9_SEGRC|nr:FAD-linked oxidase C-terminal domain-containing protein [Segniliparus rugosus]EFV14697.1 glycolate oxidase, subunit GlcD [Segniliparus rugosus ATCC BAA-974]